MAIVAALLASASARAADFTIAPPPAWVQKVTPPAAPRNDGAIDIRLVDLQIRIDAAGMHQYVHQIVRVLQPQALQAVGTFGAVWQPATDRITIHRVVIHRADQDIDVLKDGSPLQVIRREEKLEAAFIDGKLTATMPVSDLRVDDEIEYAYTIDSLNPLFGSHREADQLFARTAQFDRLYVRNSWPSASGMRWRIGEGLPKPTISKTGDGQTVLTIDRADFLAPNVPAQSPGRFIDANRLQLSDLADWQALSSLFAPIFEAAATPAADSPLRAEIARIAAASSDPKARATAALQLVQSQVRYLARLDGLGGYQPASADVVWRERLGDCKGKTVLLLALLRGLGIDARPAIVSAQQSDGVDISLPAAGRFDHVLVRAAIGGKVYWLDGTRLGDRDLDQLAVPGFQWALPLTRPGSGLERLVATEPSLPTEEWTLDLDARDGIALPAKATGTGVFRGDAASGFRTSMTFLSEAQRQEVLRKLWSTRHDWVEIKDVTYAFDEKLGEVRIGFAGTGEMDWNFKGTDATFRYQANKAFLGQLIAPTRAATDPDVPVKVDERYTVTHQTIFLPNNGKGFYVDGEAIDRTEGGLHYVRTASVRDGKFQMTASTRSKAAEVSFAVAKAADKQATEIFGKDLYVHMPSAYELTSQERAKRPAFPAGSVEARIEVVSALLRKQDFPGALKEIDAGLKDYPKNVILLVMKGSMFLSQGKMDEADTLFDAALAADGSHIIALGAKADLLVARRRYEDALILYDRAVLLQPGNGAAYYGRGTARMMLGRYEPALADMLLSIDKRPDFAEARTAAITILWKLNRIDEALQQADAFVKVMPDSPQAHAIRGDMLFFAGKKDEASASLQRSLAIRPSANAYMALLVHGLAKDQAAALAYVLAIIAAEPARLIPGMVLVKLPHDPATYAALVAAYDKAIREHPDDKVIPKLRRNVDLEFGHVNEALTGLDREIAALDRDVATSPKRADLLNEACWARATHRVELDKALADCDAGIAIEKGPGILDSRGLVYVQRGEWPKAIADYDAALAMMPQLPSSLYGRGLARIRSGNAKDGNVDLIAARKVNPEIDAEFAGYGLKP